jgi:hypothetical protein
MQDFAPYLLTPKFFVIALVIEVKREIRKLFLFYCFFTLLGLLIGTLTMEYGGTVKIECEKTGYHTEIEFKLKVNNILILKR